MPGKTLPAVCEHAGMCLSTVRSRVSDCDAEFLEQEWAVALMTRLAGCELDRRLRRAKSATFARCSLKSGMAVCSSSKVARVQAQLQTDASI